MSSEFATIPEVVRAAKARLGRGHWDYAAGGSETEASLRRNRRALDSLAFRPRVLRNVEQRSPETTFLGHRLGLPVMIAPIGGIGRFDCGGSLSAARAAARFATGTFLSTVGSPSIEALAAGTDALRFFQLYCYGDHEWSLDLIRRAERAGYAAICVTVDIASYGRRDRDLANGFHGRAGGFANLASHDRDYMQRVTWDDVRRLRDATRLPFMLKGIMAPEDALLAAEIGADAIVVSNHGGRQIDFALAGIEVLPEIAEAVGDRLEILVDGGFERGTDVLKAIALGARAVLIGKLACYALAAGGEAALHRTLELLDEELRGAMALLGVIRVAELGPQYLRRVTPI